MKRGLQVLIGGLALTLAQPAGAAVTGKVTFVSEYVLRGISQTNQEPAIQGSIDWSHESGFYAGVWGSNVDFRHIGLTLDAQAEFDLYGGWAWTGDKGFGIDIGLIHYHYPGEGAVDPLGDSDDLNYEEVYFGVKYKIFSLKVYYTDDFLGFDVEETYTDASLAIPLGADFTLTLHGGYSTFNPQFLEDYYDYKVGLSRAFGKLSLEVSYIDTDEKLLLDHSDQRVVAAVSYSG
jgi:uncharacterized protein (TIGR02001 family)